MNYEWTVHQSEYPAPADGVPGPWFAAGCAGDVCSRGGEPICAGDAIRADGNGGWECRDCVNEDTAHNDNAAAALELWDDRAAADEMDRAS